MNPYLLLGVPRNADDQTIRRSYLEAIKKATPETDPERFKALTAAYDRIKDETRRLEYELFHTECPGNSPIEAFFTSPGPPPKPISIEAMKEFLRLCSKM